MLSFQYINEDFADIAMNNVIGGLARAPFQIATSMATAKLNQNTQLDTMQKRHDMQMQHNVENFQQQQQLNNNAAQQQNSQQIINKNNPNQPQPNSNRA